MRVCFLTVAIPSYSGSYLGNFIEGIVRAIASVGNEVFVFAPKCYRNQVYRISIPPKHHYEP